MLATARGGDDFPVGLFVSGWCREKRSPMSRLASEVSFILFLLYLPFYGVCIGFICAAIAAVRRRSYLMAALLAGIVAFPLANYCYAYFWAVHEAPQARRADVASWPRLRIAHDNKPVFSSQGCASRTDFFQVHWLPLVVSKRRMA
jgi:hypothetical protein